jgi:hypothetical protein
MIDLASLSSLRSVRTVCGFALPPSFPASFSLVRFFWRSKRNEQFNREQAEKQKPQNYLQP